MIEKVKIKGLGSMELVEGSPEPGKDYLLSIRCSRSGVENDEEDLENPIRTYIMKYLATERFQEIGSFREIKVVKGKTPSQKLRWLVYEMAVKLGKDPEEYYHKRMSELIEQERQRLEE